MVSVTRSDGSEQAPVVGRIPWGRIVAAALSTVALGDVPVSVTDPLQIGTVVHWRTSGTGSSLRHMDSHSSQNPTARIDHSWRVDEGSRVAAKIVCCARHSHYQGIARYLWRQLRRDDRRTARISVVASGHCHSADYGWLGAVGCHLCYCRPSKAPVCNFHTVAIRIVAMVRIYRKSHVGAYYRDFGVRVVREAVHRALPVDMTRSQSDHMRRLHGAVEVVRHSRLCIDCLDALYKDLRSHSLGSGSHNPAVLMAAGTTVARLVDLGCTVLRPDKIVGRQYGCVACSDDFQTSHDVESCSRRGTGWR